MDLVQATINVFTLSFILKNRFGPSYGHALIQKILAKIHEYNNDEAVASVALLRTAFTSKHTKQKTNIKHHKSWNSIRSFGHNSWLLTY